VLHSLPPTQVKENPLTELMICLGLQVLTTISQTKGDKAQGRKVAIIKGLMVRCVENEAKFLIRALQGKLRIGTAAQTVLVSLAHAFAHSDNYKSDTAAESSTAADTTIAICMSARHKDSIVCAADDTEMSSEGAAAGSFLQVNYF
jgi:ATP-dependent DNA ligase